MKKFRERVLGMQKNAKREAREFMPKNITKEAIAPAFNIRPEQISDEELLEIQEFSANAGMEMTRRQTPDNGSSLFL